MFNKREREKGKRLRDREKREEKEVDEQSVINNKKNKEDDIEFFVRNIEI